MDKATKLPGLNCGLCGFRTCKEFSVHLKKAPRQIKRCIPLSKGPLPPKAPPAQTGICGSLSGGECGDTARGHPDRQQPWHDSLGREFDFYLEHFPEDPGPREVIIPRNPMLTRELEITAGDIIIGRPLGVSCGCPITHCGKVMKVEKSTGVIVWCVTGPLQPRKEGYKDLGYYSTEAYEGIVREARGAIKIGMRYYFQPRMLSLIHISEPRD